jgi:hypothetical protein
MLGPPTSELVAGLGGLVVAALLLGLGYLIVDLVAGKRDLDETDRWGLSLAGICAVAFVMMIVHLATGGWLFSHPLVVRLIVAVAFVGLLAARLKRRSARDGKHLWIAGLLVLSSLFIWGSPVARMMPLTATADTQLHNGWIDQLMAGDPMFEAVLIGDVPNYYPWMFHSLGAITTTLTPGGTPYHSLAPLQLLQVAGCVLALFALGRALTGRAMTGFGAALLGALSGGFGFVLLDGLDVVSDPRAGDGAAALMYQGDLLFSRSYNVGFHNLAPPFPRDLAFGLLISFVTLLAMRARSTNAWTEVAAGCCLGMVGLTGGETFIVGVALGFVVAIVDSDHKLLSLARILGPALAIYAIWFVPIVSNYSELGGFVSITHIIPVALPASAILVSWGLATPLAVFGAVRLFRPSERGRGPRLCVAFAITAAALLAVSTVIPELLGDAFDTLGRKHRYWPIFYLSVALLGALGFTHLLTWCRERSRALGVAALIALTAIAWGSPVVASLALPINIGRYPGIEEAMREEPGALLYELRRSGRGCNIAVPQEISREVFSYTGFRLVLWTGNWFGANRARIRWGDIYDKIGSQEQRIVDNKALISNATDPTRWSELVERYDVDIVVLPETELGGDALDGLDVTDAHYEETTYGIVQVGTCGSR